MFRDYNFSMYYKELKIRYDFTSKEIAAVCKCSTPKISLMVNGKRKITAHFLKCLKIYLQLPKEQYQFLEDLAVKQNDHMGMYGKYFAEFEANPVIVKAFLKVYDTLKTANDKAKFLDYINAYKK